MTFNNHALCLYLVFVVTRMEVGSAAPVRVAVTPFHWESNNPKVAEKSAEYAMMFFTGALEVENVQMVERGDESPLWDEITLSGSEMPIAWKNVDVVVRGRFEMQGGNTGIEFLWPYRLKLEIIDVTNADILEMVILEKNETGHDDPVRESLLKQAPNLLQKAIARRDLLKNTPRFFPLFFFNRSPNERLGNFELNFRSILAESLKKRAVPMASLSFGGSEDALEEQTLNWLGFTDVDRSEDWKNVADYFIWGEYAEVASEKSQAHEDIEVNATLHWLAKDGTTGKADGTFRVGDFEKGVSEIASKIPGGRVSLKESGEVDGGKRVSDLLFERAVPLLEGYLQQVVGNDPKIDEYLSSKIQRVENDYAKQLVFTCCLFDPGDLKKQYVLFHFGRNSENPVLNGRKIRRIESWLLAASRTPKEMRLPRAASGNLILERLKLSRQSWWYPSSYKERSIPEYQTLESTESFIGLIAKVTAILGEDNVQKRRPTNVTVEGHNRSKRIGYADRYASDILDNVISFKWMNPEQKARVFNLAWCLIPESQRKDFLVWKKEDVGELEDEIGSEKWKEILESPSSVHHPELVTSPAKDSMDVTDTLSGRPGYRNFVVAAELRTARPVKDRFRFSREIEKDFRNENFILDSIRKITPSQVVASGKFETKGGQISPWQESFMVFDSANPKSRFRPTSFGKSIPKIFEADRNMQWSSDGVWGVRQDWKVDDTKSVDTRFLDLFRLIQISPQGNEIADLSPPDLNLIKNTGDRIVLVGDRWVVLISYAETHFDINYCELSKKDWRSRTLSLPALKGNSSYGKEIHLSKSTSFTCEQWVFFCRGNNALLVNMEDNKTYPLDKVYSAIIDRNLDRIRSSLEKGNLTAAEIRRAADAWKFSIGAVSSSNGRIFLLHSVGVSSFNPSGLVSGSLDIQHLDIQDQNFKLYDNGETRWRPHQYHCVNGELENIWFWFVQDYPTYSTQVTRKMFLLDRKEMKLKGSVELAELIKPRELLTLKDSALLVFDSFSRSSNGQIIPVSSKVLTVISKEELIQAATRQMPHPFPPAEPSDRTDSSRPATDK